ncbi:DUF3611 family protein [Thermoleptolyngbya sichuanensis XZ-Cy5]|uniref:DUF3611 family protein n=1 Tax=Thermoleptolyngbya sichuanensis TaxID=2885951 RepID=UPI00240DE97E|nr:DUF3611 family protein [Thermoleptolyngbya sichuanensis]MDG2617688.1 DUF3611 family protein [Thermoleptolyngbya sichuanensis XZ-Cy5]
MQTKPDLRSPANRALDLSRAFWWVGLLSVLLQMGLGAAAVAALVSASRSNLVLDEPPVRGIGIGIFWAVCGCVLLLVAIANAFRYIRISQCLRRLDLEQHPKTIALVRLLRVGIVLGLVGALVTLVGAEVSIATLMTQAETSSALANTQGFVRILNLQVVAANLHLVAAHFAGLTLSLGLYDWFRRQ